MVIGDVVVRKSYDKDITFKIKKELYEIEYLHSISYSSVYFKSSIVKIFI